MVEVPLRVMHSDAGYELIFPVELCTLEDCVEGSGVRTESINHVVVIFQTSLVQILLN